MNWKITQIQTINNPRDVVIVNVSFSISDGVSTIQSDTNLLPEDAESFISLATPSEEQILQWVKSALDRGVEDNAFSNVKRYEHLVDRKTNEQKPQLVPMPWEK
jgi:hypothetical protein